MLQIPTCLLPQGADSRKQEQGPNRMRDAGSWEGKEVESVLPQRGCSGSKG